MKRIKEVLAKIYDNDELRKSVVPLFIGNPGMGKTKMIEQFVEERGVRLVELITSQMSPFEISGIAMPDKDTKKMTYYNFDKLETLKDGDVLFFDELLNGNPIVLNACLTILEQRTLISGKKLPNIMIVAAANPQGMVPLTPQIKERFLWYNVMFDAPMWQKYMSKKMDMPFSVSGPMAQLIAEENFINNNFATPRSLLKATNMLAKECPTPYADAISPLLSKVVFNRRIKGVRKMGRFALKPGESVNYIDVLKNKKPSKVVIKGKEYTKSELEYKLVFSEMPSGKKTATLLILRRSLDKTIAEARAIVDALPTPIASSSNMSEYKINLLRKELELLGNVLVMEEIPATQYNLFVRGLGSKSEDAIDYLKKALGVSKKEIKAIRRNEDVIVSKGSNTERLNNLKDEINAIGCLCELRAVK
mgnify:CR=1 FL=1